MQPQENFNQGRGSQPPPPPPPDAAAAPDAPAVEQNPTPPAPPRHERIIALYDSGTTDVAQLCRLVGAAPFVIARTLRQAGRLEGYFDLFTSTSCEQNAYSRFFRGVLSIKSVKAARRSVQKIDRLYEYFRRLEDRAGQHHAQLIALTGQNRARASNKPDVAEIFHDWLAAH